MNPIELPILETICKKQISTYGTYLPNCGSVGLTFSPKLSRDVSHSQTAQKTGRSYLLLINAFYEHLMGVERNTNQFRKNYGRNGLSAGKRGTTPDFGMKLHRQSNQEKSYNESIEALAARAKTLCPQDQFRRAAKILSYDGVAPDNIQTFRELRTLHHLKEETRLQFQDYSSQAH